MESVTNFAGTRQWLALVHSGTTGMDSELQCLNVQPENQPNTGQQVFDPDGSDYA